VRQAGFTGVFTFIYSPRTGTPSASRTDTVPENIAAARFKRLNELINPILLRRNEGLIGKTLDIMMEEDKSGKNNTQKGHADDNTLVHVAGAAREPGEIIQVRVTEAKTFYVSGVEVFL
jgi:tRNA-2-methylthio-N6-dimethylallyladenosine synthase